MAAPYDQFVLFGDSLIEACCDAQDGFAFYGSLQKLCQRRYDVVNRGFSGYNTSQMLKIIESIFPEPTPSGPHLKYLIILIGANDAAIEMPKDNQGLPLEQYKENLKAIVTHPRITAHRPDKIMVVTPPPIDEIRITELDVANGYGRAMRLQARSARYSEAARQVANEAGGAVVLVDLHAALMDHAISKTAGWDASQPPLGSPEAGRRGHLEKLLPDGLHMSGEAYRVFYDLIAPHIAPEHPFLSQEGFVYPEWRTAPWL